jgi:hypothetical protein
VPSPESLDVEKPERSRALHDNDHGRPGSPE